MKHTDNIRVDIGLLKNYVDKKALLALQPEIDRVIKSIRNKTCAGNDFLGWLDLPFAGDSAELRNLDKVANEIRANADHLVCIGIGGSYLGARAAIDFLSSPFDKLNRKNKIIYLGHQLSTDYVYDLLRMIKNKKVYINVISKSGTTTEPGVVFRIVLDYLKNKVDAKTLAERIIATTDAKKGALHDMAVAEKYRMFVIPDNVGGRFSVLTPVGLLPIAAAGFDTHALLEGAKSMAQLCRDNDNVLDNPALTYAAARYLLYNKNKEIEILSAFDPGVQYVGEWWKQLYGESEGKEGKGIFPASTIFTTDLHSMGQYIQEGERNLFETFVTVKKMKRKVTIPELAGNKDGMNYLAGMDLAQVNHQAYRGTALAHFAGDVPNMTITLPKKDEYYLGQLFFMFEYAVAVSGLLLGINPFNQPGVEAYKQNMFALLGKPGYEDLKKQLTGK
ncbi:MAG TPA: glucose-6-phosphate isomerase [bacterium]|nr:glucose-6-phosphate isomerase [bacterium]HPN44760.1 glucose-6-phosphate isomerase [bacterium]